MVVYCIPSCPFVLISDRNGLCLAGAAAAAALAAGPWPLGREGAARVLSVPRAGEPGRALPDPTRARRIEQCNRKPCACTHGHVHT